LIGPPATSGLIVEVLESDGRLVKLDPGHVPWYKNPIEEAHFQVDNFSGEDVKKVALALSDLRPDMIVLMVSRQTLSPSQVRDFLSPAPDEWKCPSCQQGNFFSELMSRVSLARRIGALLVADLPVNDVPCVHCKAIAKFDDITAGRHGSHLPPPQSSCFIATVAMGAPLHGDVEMLRVFRDEYLQYSIGGRTFIAIYYRVSPSIADFLSRHDCLRVAVRDTVVHPLARLISWREKIRAVK